MLSLSYLCYLSILTLHFVCLLAFRSLFVVVAWYKQWSLLIISLMKQGQLPPLHLLLPCLLHAPHCRVCVYMVISVVNNTMTSVYQELSVAHDHLVFAAMVMPQVIMTPQVTVTHEVTVTSEVTVTPQVITVTTIQTQTVTYTPTPTGCTGIVNHISLTVEYYNRLCRRITPGFVFVLATGAGIQATSSAQESSSQAVVLAGLGITAALLLL